MLLYLDSNIFIYILAGTEPHCRPAIDILRSIELGEHHAITSSIAYGEVIGSITNDKHIKTAHALVEQLLNFKTIPVNDPIAKSAGKLRASSSSNLRLPDAIHLGTALAGKADLFITNDIQLAKTTQAHLPTKTLAEW